jgi:hypothetical protein
MSLAPALIAQEHERRDLRPHASAEFVEFISADRSFAFEHPADWRAYERGARVNVGASDGLVATGRGFRTIYGAIVDVLDDPLAGRSDRTLEASTRAIVERVLARNPHQAIHEPVGADAPLGGRPAYRAVLMGTSPVTGRGERAEIICREFGVGKIFQIILVAPAEAFSTLTTPLERIRDSVRVPAGEAK